MNKIILSKQNNFFEFKIDSEKTVIRIKTVSLVLNKKTNENWIDKISRIKLKAILIYLLLFHF